MENIKKILKNFGLSENESRVYLAMLGCGEATIAQVAKQAKLNRITVHHIVERLEKSELATHFKRDKKTFVLPAHPVKLQKKIQESTEMLGKAVPELVAMMRDNSKKKPVVRMYYGVEGFEKVAEELLERPNSTIRHIGSLAEAHKFIGVEYDKEYFIPTRVSKNIHYRMLTHEGEIAPVLQATKTDDLREVRSIPKNYNIRSNTFMISGKVIIVTTKDELMSVVIESEDISESEIQKFDLLWNLLK